MIFNQLVDSTIIKSKSSCIFYVFVYSDKLYLITEHSLLVLF